MSAEAHAYRPVCPEPRASRRRTAVTSRGAACSGRTTSAGACTLTGTPSTTRLAPTAISTGVLPMTTVTGTLDEKVSPSSDSSTRSADASVNVLSRQRQVDQHQRARVRRDRDRDTVDDRPAIRRTEVRYGDQLSTTVEVEHRGRRAGREVGHDLGGPSRGRERQPRSQRIQDTREDLRLGVLRPLDPRRRHVSAEVVPVAHEVAGLTPVAARRRVAEVLPRRLQVRRDQRTRRSPATVAASGAADSSR